MPAIESCLMLPYRMMIFKEDRCIYIIKCMTSIFFSVLDDFFLKSPLRPSIFWWLADRANVAEVQPHDPFVSKEPGKLISSYPTIFFSQRHIPGFTHVIFIKVGLLFRYVCFIRWSIFNNFYQIMTSVYFHRNF